METSNYIHSLSNMPSQTIYASPLKKRQNLENIIFSNSITLNVTSNKRFKASISDNIDKSNQIETLAISKDQINEIFENICLKLKNQVSLIIDFMTKLNFPSEEYFEICKTAAIICTNDRMNEKEKMSELGILFYCLVCNKKLPANTNLTEFRIEEIDLEIKDLKRIHKERCPENLQKLIPSGCNAYLLRVFVRMIFPPDGSFNPGGCQAVINMMESRLIRYLPEEGRLQTLRIANRLMTNSKFLDYFLTEFKVDKKLEELILTDMKYSKEEEFNFVFVRWALLMVFFNPIGQFSEPNCFAVASLANLINDEEMCDPVIEILINVLKTGKFTVEGNDISVLPLINIQPFHNAFFESVLSYETLLQMTGFSAVKECLIPSEVMENSNNINISSDNPQTLKSILQSKFGAKTEEAHKLLLSFKQVSLQQMLLSIVQFISLNTIGTTIGSRLTEKNFLLENIYYNLIGAPLFQATPLQNEEIQNFTFEFYKVIAKELYFIDCVNYDYIQKNDSILYSSDLERKLCVINEGGGSVIGRISQFQSYLKSVNSKIINMLNLQNNESMIKFTSFLDSYEFMFKVALVNININRDNDALKMYHHLYYDTFFIPQLGGNTNFLHNCEPFISRFNNKISFESNSVESFFKLIRFNLFNYFTSNPLFFKKIAPLILVESKKHVYNICPYLFKKYWTNTNEKIINENVINRAVALNKLTPNRINRIFELTIPKEIKAKFFNKFNKISFLNNFSKSVKKDLDISSHSLFDTSIDTAMNEISFTSVRKQLSPLIEGILNKNLYSAYQQKLLEKIGRRELSASYISPYDLAKLIHKILLTSTPCVFTPICIIENYVRKFFHLPEVISVANLNWVNELSEKPVYNFLCIKYDFALQKLAFCIRSNGIERPLSQEFAQDIFDETTIIFSK